MWKKAKALVEPLERLMTTWGTKGPKSNTTHSGGNSQISNFTKQPKQQVSEIQKQIVVNNLTNSNKTLEKTLLRNFLFENFSIFKIFSPQPVPVPVVFSQTPLRLCKPHGFGLISQRTFLHPAGTRNVIGRSGRNFSTIQPSMMNNCTGSGGTILAQLGFKPFSAFAKSGSLWFQREEDDLNNNKFNVIKKLKAERKKEVMGHKLSVQNNNKGILEIVKNSNVIEEDKNKLKVVRKSNIKKSSEENKTVENVPELTFNNNENVQVYMSIILSSSVFWNLDDSISLSNSTNSVNSTSSVLSYLLQHRNDRISQRHNSQLNPSFVQYLQEIAELQHDHMMEVISILGTLLRHGDFEIKINGCELLVNFPRGMQKIEIENMLQNLGIDPNSSHFELEEIYYEENIGENYGGIDLQFPEPNSTYFENATIDSPGYEILSYSSSSDSSPVLIPSRGSMDCTSEFSSPCNTPPRLGSEYITGIQEFLNAVDEALVRNTNMFNNREDDEIGEDYYEN
ncbi:hypothetical protein RclHR1_03550008 [Rhizophagus clarus]|uniref:Uncharacterized protein n=1 Tax=Rhizophagus clarus TaxID=94130 RepID=A0A2Z6S5Z4_9GLOM|nr:hypothetical protein RclHR1_03550008 [Rhizophagus clarus]GES77501.1 hypothetical protein GLOIN_2v1564955 [Rhizophagus clarus]